jgi:hypothetical protein
MDPAGKQGFPFYRPLLKVMYKPLPCAGLIFA